MVALERNKGQSNVSGTSPKQRESAGSATPGTLLMVLQNRDKETTSSLFATFYVYDWSIVWIMCTYRAVCSTGYEVRLFISKIPSCRLNTKYQLISSDKKSSPTPGQLHAILPYEIIVQPLGHSTAYIRSMYLAHVSAQNEYTTTGWSNWYWTTCVRQTRRRDAAGKTNNSIRSIAAPIEQALHSTYICKLGPTYMYMVCSQKNVRSRWDEIWSQYLMWRVRSMCMCMCVHMHAMRFWGWMRLESHWLLVCWISGFLSN